jgi:hypothetical protein
MRHLFPCSRVGWRRPRWQRVAVRRRRCMLCFSVGRKKVASWLGGPKGQVGWLAAGPIGLEAKNPFRIKVEFLN